MKLFGSKTDGSTASIENSRKTSYQKWLNLCIVILLIISTVIIFTAVILIKFYHINKLDFWSPVFNIVPTYTIVLGVYTFVICMFGFGVTASDNYILIAIYAGFLAVAFIAQLGTIFVSMELRTIINQGAVGGANVIEDLEKYGIDSGITAKWDELQRYMHCCGGNTFLTGYNDYKNTPLGLEFSVPDSCCHEPQIGCGRNIFKENPEQIRNKIFVNGCLALLQDQLELDVVNLMIMYACLGVIMALVELITVALACAFVAQINRAKKRLQH